MKTSILTWLALMACIASQAQSLLPTIEYMGGLGVPVSDHQLLTVSHIGAVGMEDTGSDLVLVSYPTGTFCQWAEISFDQVADGSQVTVAVREDGVEYHSQRVISTPGIYLRTGPLLESGDSGGGVFDASGLLVGVNMGYNPANRDSYHIATFERADWLRQNVAVTVVPEPEAWVLMLALGIPALIWRIGK